MEGRRAGSASVDYVTNRETRLFHVGRPGHRDRGRHLLTNHGEAGAPGDPPKYGVKRRLTWGGAGAIVGPDPRDLGKRLKDGILLEDGYARAGTTSGSWRDRP
ncbi:hypothetical protein GCM10023238_03100 [Streptomyces heliomycini]